MIHHLRFLSLFCLILLAAAGCRDQGLRFPDRNVILISIDTLRADALGAYGDEHETSPRIDRLSREGIRFERAYSPSCVTAPSHMSLLTSLHPTVHLVDNWSFIVDAKGRSKYARRRLKSGVPTLASALQEAGYFTAAFVGGGNIGSEMGFGQGFEIFDDEPDNGMNGNREHLFDPTRALEWIEEHRHGKFFAFLHTYIPHGPYLPPPPWDEHFGRDYQGPIPSRRDAFFADGETSYHKRAQSYWDAVNPDDPDEVEHLRAMYRGDVRYADDAIARIFDRLAEMDLFEDSIIVVVSDHGEEFQEHGSFEHQKKLYRELVHVPLIVRLPGARGAGMVVAEPVSLLDVMPTVLDLVDLPAPEEAQGRSLVPLLETGAPALPVVSEKILAWEVDGVSKSAPIWNPTEFLRSVRDDRWTYIQKRSASALVEELYDRSRDPDELRNRTGDPESAETLRRFRDLLEGHGRRCGALAEVFAGSETSPLRERTVKELEALGYLRGESN